MSLSPRLKTWSFSFGIWDKPHQIFHSFNFIFTSLSDLSLHMYRSGTLQTIHGVRYVLKDVILRIKLDQLHNSDQVSIGHAILASMRLNANVQWKPVLERSDFTLCGHSLSVSRLSRPSTSL